MADSKKTDSSVPHPFDVHVVDHLVKLMSQHDLSEVHLEEGDQVIRLRRGPRHVPMAAATMLAPAPSLPAVQANTTVPATSTPPQVEAASTTGKKLLEVKSPTPGTFYRASSPDAEPFVKVGSKVKADTVVCIIEAMKVFNEIPAEVTGTIAAIKVEDKAPVEYGQVLFLVEAD
ncbi:MAG TPA: acetyl-CoA carboxylase biotin carboxyl carrier protein [Gemmatales bacterium]|nr:acetyl-CoA carboxylase biotin carboxyl carrier protein [Gemmatales bacterium]HMP15829.1 acetyl-CoA carboxylase biotin carboxyl carrier protein [Gemmatales bacterium]